MAPDARFDSVACFHHLDGMSAMAQLLEQRSVGQVHLRMEQRGVAVLREEGSAKCRIPSGTSEAILINTSGGLAGGDNVEIKAEAGPQSSLTVTSQAAERVYRSLGPSAAVSITLKAETGSTLLWAPQETILFQGSDLARTMDVDLAAGSVFCAVESLVFGRTEMGEATSRVSVRDRWTIRLGGSVVHTEALRIEPGWASTLATFAGHCATSTLLLVSPASKRLLPGVRAVISPSDGASEWNGKLVARFLAKDSFHLRKSLIPALSVCVGHDRLPKCWTF